MSTEMQGETCLNFLTSETISLKAPGSTCTFKIHKDLLESKCKTLAAAFRSGFSEGQDGTYTCFDTTDGTLARFVQWAYRGDYSASMVNTDLMQMKVKPAEESDGEEDAPPAPVVSESANLELDNHPLLTHLRLYIFSETYLVADLKQLAFEKLTACFVDINRPQTLDEQRAVIAVLRAAFLKVPSHDRLLDWLAHYAAYCVCDLRVQPSFHDVLDAVPALSSLMMSTLNPASDAPWDSQAPKHQFPRYKPGTYEDQYE